MKIAIIGTGFTGLTAGYFLSKKGHQVVIYDKNKASGGLAGSFKELKWQWPLEKYFHHYFTSDNEVLSLAHELGLDKKIFWGRPRTSIFAAGKIFQFDSPTSILNSPFLSLPEKIRTGFVTAVLKIADNHDSFSKVSAYSWLSRFYGKKVFNLVWKPLLEGKFGLYSRDVIMTWFWARIKKRSTRLGYFQGGFAVLQNKLISQIVKAGGEIKYSRMINDLLPLQKKYDRILFTGSTQELLLLSNIWPRDYQERLKNLKMIGAINLVVTTEKQFLKDKTYWLNINDSRFPFIALVEQTNFISPKYYNGDHLLYLGGYYPTNHPFFKYNKEELWQFFEPYVKKINPEIKVKKLLMFKTSFAQPIVTHNYHRHMPHLQTPIKNVFIANMQMIYPWDRGVNYAIKLGKEAAKKITAN